MKKKLNGDLSMLTYKSGKHDEPRTRTKTSHTPLGVSRNLSLSVRSRSIAQRTPAIKESKVERNSHMTNSSQNSKHK